MCFNNELGGDTTSVTAFSFVASKIQNTAKCDRLGRQHIILQRFRIIKMESVHILHTAESIVQICGSQPPRCAV